MNEITTTEAIEDEPTNGAIVDTVVFTPPAKPRRGRRVATWIALSVCVITIAALVVLLNDSTSQVDDLEGQLADADIAWAEISSELETTQTELATQKERADDAEAHATQLQHDLDAALAANTAAATKIDGLEQQLAKAIEARDKAQADLKETRAAFEGLEFAVRHFFAAAFISGFEATPEQAQCAVDYLEQNYGLIDVLEWDTAFATDGVSPQEGEKAYTFAFIECGIQP